MTIQNYVDPFRNIVLCVDSYTNKCISGNIYSPAQAKNIQFRSAIEMLLGIESLLTDSPQPFTAKRTFFARAENIGSTASAATVQKGSMATFSLKILFRQNASWQGSIVWQEGKTEESFRSVLELILLIDSALASLPTANE